MLPKFSIWLILTLMIGTVNIVTLPDIDGVFEDIEETVFEFPIEPGSTILVDPPSIPINRSYYPIPQGSTVLSENISVSSQFEEGIDHPNHVWFNVGEGSKEYEFKQIEILEIGNWGRLNQTIEGYDEVIADTSDSNPFSMEFLLPKNISISDSSFTIHGHQRKNEWNQHPYLFTQGSFGGNFLKMS